LKSHHGATYICLELGATHRGVDDALTMIARVAESCYHGGVALPDAIKFQVHTTEEIVGLDYTVSYQGRNGAVVESSIRELLRAREMSESSWRRVFASVREHGMDCFGTPGGIGSLDMLVRLGSSAIKIAGADMDYQELIEAAARTGLPVLLDARCSHAELRAAVGWVLPLTSAPVTLVYSSGGYPCRPEEVGLLKVQWLCAEYVGDWPQVAIGYTDHAEGIDMCTGAVALGARYVEKPLVGEDTAESPEGAAGLLYQQVPGFVEAIRLLEKGLHFNAAPVGVQHRRSCFAAREIQPGESITRAMVRLLRPGTGIPVRALDSVLGRVARRPVKAGAMIRWEDLSPDGC